MEEREILGLVRAASELDDLDAAVAGGRAGQARAPQGPKPPVGWWAIGVAVAAAAVLFVVFLRPMKLTIREFTVAGPAAQTPRGLVEAEPGAQEADSRLSITLELNRRAYVRIILIDERHERWLMPFDVDAGEYAGIAHGTAAFRVSQYPKRDDPRGPARAEIAMVVASAGPAPAPDDLLEAIPDPVLPAESKDQALYDELDQIRDALESRFDCVVKFARVPK